MTGGIFFDAKDASQYTDVPPNMVDQTLADDFTAQVESFYGLPRKRRYREEVVFSPSGVNSCARELYYINTNAERDVTPLIPWRERMSRNGTGAHDVTQADYLTMEDKLREAGLPVKFRFLAAEIDGEKSYTVGGTVVKLRGRSDGKMALLDDKGEEVAIIGYEKKTKDKRKNLNKIMKLGQPQAEHRAQATSYYLIFGIKRWMFEYESLQKPEWKEVVPEKPDQKHFYVEVSEEEARALLIRLAKIVRQIEAGQLPDPELDKCGFCQFKGQCAKDGGYDEAEHAKAVKKGAMAK
jgi:CRISPR/Cas system-associated exonuclease Cas4 (RecB family)